jgi:probable HAF family extracellular repeat protein
LLLGGSSFLTAEILYSVTSLGTLPGGDFTIGYGINNAGQVTGAALFLSPMFSTHAFLYKNGQITDITAGQVLPDGLSTGFTVNSTGQVAGFAELAVG